MENVKFKHEMSHGLLGRNPGNVIVKFIFVPHCSKSLPDPILLIAVEKNISP